MVVNLWVLLFLGMQIDRLGGPYITRAYISQDCLPVAWIWVIPNSSVRYRLNAYFVKNQVIISLFVNILQLKLVSSTTRFILITSQLNLREYLGPPLHPLGLSVHWTLWLVGPQILPVLQSIGPHQIDLLEVCLSSSFYKVNTIWQILLQFAGEFFCSCILVFWFLCCLNTLRRLWSIDHGLSPCRPFSVPPAKFRHGPHSAPEYNGMYSHLSSTSATWRLGDRPYSPSSGAWGWLPRHFWCRERIFSRLEVLRNPYNPTLSSWSGPGQILICFWLA